jgi:diguanylate cyclase (GGDEF)-like protein/PAS domain S-box-containing protein
MKNQIKRYGWLLFLFVIMISQSFLYVYGSPGEETDAPKRILFISSYSPSFPTFSLQLEGFRSVLNEAEVEIKVEYMDSKIFYMEENLQLFYDMMEFKLTHSDAFDVVVAADDNALQFVFDNEEDFFSDIPVVFLGINNRELAQRGEDHPFVTGVVEEISMQETLELAWRINPQAKEVVALVDSSVTGSAELSIFNEVMQEFDGLSPKVFNLGNFTFEEAANEIQQMDDHSIVLLLSFYRDKTGKTITYHELYKYISKHAHYPIYRLYSEGLGEGFFGGKLINHYEQGKNAGEMVGKILSGISINEIPIMWESPNVYMFDYEMLQKYNMDEALFPKETIFINKSPKFYEQYTTLVWSSASILSLLLIVIIVMQLNTLRRKRAEAELVESHEQLTALYEELEASDEELRAQFDMIQESRSALMKSKERYKYVFSASNDGLWDMDMSTMQIYLSNDWYCSFFGDDYNLEQVTIKDWVQKVHPEDKSFVIQKMKEIKNGNTERNSCEYRVININNEVIWIHQNSISCFESGKLVRIIGSHTNITTRKNQEYRILNLAYRDTLTGLPNRAAFQENLINILKKKEGFYINGAIMFLDLDNFKYINDTYGHSIGDKVLIEVGIRLKTLANDETNIYRFGGDEFIILMDQVKDLNEVKGMADKIIDLFQEKYMIGDQSFYLSTSIGIVLYPFDGVEAHDLLKHADSAMYKAKEKGKSQYQFFNRTMNKEISDKMYIHNNLRSALENKEFELYFQPQVETKTKKIIGFEALIRWNSKEFGFVPPDKFIKVAEESDMIVKIGNWVIKEASIFSKEINKDRKEPVVVSVNVSSVQLMQDDFIRNVKDILEQVNVDPSYIGMEITETALMKSFEANAKKIWKLKDMGIQTGLDDFGTGYSSLNYLRQLPINILKIDKSFIDDLAKKNQHNLTEDIVMISQKLGLQVVAEGVESEEQFGLLSDYRCDIIQGYYISKPLPKKDALLFISNN